MKTIALLLALSAPPAHPALKPQIHYTLRVDPADLSGWTVEIRLRTGSDTIRLAMAAHPEYDDRYWRYVTGFTAVPASGSATVTKVDSAVWQIVASRGDLLVRYRIALPPAPQGPRASWRPFLSPTGGLIGGPHAFMYLLGGEGLMVSVTLDLPAGWDVATGLEAAGQGAFTAANAAALIDSPMLVGRFSDWRFVEGGIPHRVVYWWLPDATPFDTIAFVSGIRSVVRQAFALFGRAPYRAYTFQFQDGALGALEHRNSVSLGARSVTLARDPYDALEETAHEFVHTWNLMAMRPAEYRDIDYRTQPPVSSLWFSEGLTMFYADALLRRAGQPLRDSTSAAHLERLIGSYLGNPAYARFSAESISRVAYNAEPGALGDYGASTHLQGELIGAMLDLVIRDATRGRRSIDDVMRLLFNRSPPIDGRAVEHAVETVCGCDVTPFFDAHVRGAAAIDFDRYLALNGQETRVTWGPAVWNGEPERDLRIWAWESGGATDGSLRLVISNPVSVWARAGLHSRDRLTRVNGVPVTTWPAFRAQLQQLRLGDTIRLAVERPAGPFEATVVVAGFERPTVRIEPVKAGRPRYGPRAPAGRSAATSRSYRGLSCRASNSGRRSPAQR
jgi:predicted metalloprotease with PDZ domain